MKANKSGTTLANALTPLFIIAATIVVTSLLILATGVNPFSAYYQMLLGAFSSLNNVINTINRAVPIAFAAFAVAIGTKAGLFNIGIEGQLVMGALGSAVAGAYITNLPAALHVPLCLLVGMLCGMLYALLPTVMYVFRGINLLVIHILMNSIAGLLCVYFIAGPFANENPMLSATPRIQPSAELPYLVTKPNKLHMGILIVLAVAVLLWIYFTKTTSGYQLRTVGDNPGAALYAGIRVNRYHVGALLVGGALAGLAGAVEVTGNFHRMMGGYSPGYGYDGIPIAMLAGGNPFGVVVGSLLFGALRVGSVNMQAKAGVSSEIISVIQGVLIVLIAAQYIIRFALTKLAAKRSKGGREAAK